MLRELYVAVTRAQRRVVVLVKSENEDMRRFFLALKCEMMDAETIFQEFDQATTLMQWFEKGMSLFEEEKFKLAAACFTRAERNEWTCFANGKHCLEMGLLNEGEVMCRKGARGFFQMNEMNHVLDVLQQLLDLNTIWDNVDDELFVSAIAALPKYLAKKDAVNFLLRAGRWDFIQPTHLADQHCADMFQPFRNDANLKAIVSNASDDERATIEQSLPWAHADYHMDKGNLWEAFDISINYGSVDLAEECSNRLLEDKVLRQKVDHCKQIIDRWSNFASASVKAVKHHESNIALLLLLYHDPQKAASSKSSECLRTFGHDVIRAAFDNARLDALKLLAFRDTIFNREVMKILEDQYAPNYTKVVEKLIDAGFAALANEYGRPRSWDTLDLLQLCLIMRERPKWLFLSLNRNNLLDLATWMITCSKKLSSDNKDQFRSNYKSYMNPKQGEDVEVNTNKFTSRLISCCENQKILVEVLFVWIHFERWQPAVHVSLAALDSPSLVARNLVKILQLWEGCVKIDSSMSRCSQKILFQLALLKRALPTQPQFFFNENGQRSTSFGSSSSKNWLKQALHRTDSEIDFGCLVVTFGIVAAAYVRCMADKHDHELLQSWSNYFQELTVLVKSRHEDFAATNENGARVANQNHSTSKTDKVKGKKVTTQQQEKKHVGKQKTQGETKSKKQQRKKKKQRK